jgi:hypothetical protein
MPAIKVGVVDSITNKGIDALVDVHILAVAQTTTRGRWSSADVVSGGTCIRREGVAVIAGEDEASVIELVRNCPDSVLVVVTAKSMHGGASFEDAVRGRVCHSVVPAPGHVEMVVASNVTLEALPTVICKGRKVADSKPSGTSRATKKAKPTATPNE